jgi:oligopeptide/dipeptide ABC transporter ATP-binding protein
MNTLLDVSELEITYQREDREIPAVQGVTFQVGESEILGLVGESGCGKSTVALSMIGLLPPNARCVGGQMAFHGRNLLTAPEEEWREVRWTEIALVFQEGMNALNPLMRIRDQIVEPIMLHERDHVTGHEARGRAAELLERVGIPASRGDAYPHELSGGMRQRAGIAMALACSPSLVIADEPVTALDVVVQAQILDLLAELRETLGLAMVFISHDLGVVAELCDRVAVMYAAEIVESGTATEVFQHPRHPYTAGLVACVPRIGAERKLGAALPGFPPALWAPPKGCRFHPRCPRVMAACRNASPGETVFSSSHTARCFLYE